MHLKSLKPFYIHQFHVLSGTKKEHFEAEQNNAPAINCICFSISYLNRNMK